MRWILGQEQRSGEVAWPVAPFWGRSLPYLVSYSSVKVRLSWPWPRLLATHSSSTRTLMSAPSSGVGHPCPMASSTSATRMDTFSLSACSASLIETVDPTAADSVCNGRAGQSAIVNSGELLAIRGVTEGGVPALEHADQV